MNQESELEGCKIHMRKGDCIDCAHEEIERLQAEIDSHHEEYEQVCGYQKLIRLQAQLAAKEDRIAEIATELAACHNEMGDKELEIEAKDAEIAAKDAQIEALERVVAAAKPFSKKWEKMLPGITYQDSERLQEAFKDYNERISA